MSFNVLSSLIRQSLALFVAILCSATTVPAHADNLSYSSPESVGMSAEALARIAPVMQSYVDSGELVGVVTMVARRGEIVHFEEIGVLNKDTGQAMETDSLFRIYSMTKPITTVAAMMLYEEGQFLLNDPVSKYLPEFANLRVAEQGGSLVASTRPMTIQMLMTHSSGLTYGVFGDTLVDRQYRDAQILANTDLAEMITRLGEIPLQYQPGTRFHYGVSTDVLGRVVEVISGMTLAEFFEQRIFKPLAMTDTFFEVPADKKPRFGTNHTYDPRSQTLVVSDAPETSQFANPVTFYSGGGGLVSTAEDYMRFTQMMLNGGELNGVRILGSKTIEYMTQNHLPGIFGPDAEFSGMDLGTMAKGTGFGLGFAVVEDPTAVGTIGSVGEYYWGGAAGTVFWIDPQEEVIGIAMIQHMNVRVPLRATFKALVNGAIID
ncbi:MAG: serine hydrolase domain-containing protein [Gammaproteobacteria bacterium]|nr:serine hydrolase domain-containing protein [Gammaproteobacteria bacterium]MDP2348238.1 serine hydrolase domain-containing protein [Gammaproteobacteria bacterium]